MTTKKITSALIIVLLTSIAIPLSAKVPSIHDDQKEKQWISMENGPWDFAPDWYYYFLHKNYSGAEMYWNGQVSNQDIECVSRKRNPTSSGSCLFV